MKLLGSLALTLAAPPLTSAAVAVADTYHQYTVSAESSVDEMLDQAELSIHTTIEEIEPLLLKIASNSRPLDQQQRHRLMLLQANSLILATEFELADKMLGQIIDQKPNTPTMLRAIYFRARIAAILQNFEQAFMYLDRLEKYPSPSLSTEQRLDILLLATNLYARAQAFRQATGYAQRALSIARKSNSLGLICNALRSQSDVYIIANDYERLKKSATEAVDVCNRADEQIALAASFINLSYWHRQQEDYDAQRELIEKAIGLYQRQDMVISLNPANLLLAEAFLLNNQVLEADKVMSLVFNDV